MIITYMVFMLISNSHVSNASSKHETENIPFRLLSRYELTNNTWFSDSSEDESYTGSIDESYSEHENSVDENDETDFSETELQEIQLQLLSDINKN
jgi:hypothetical protein